MPKGDREILKADPEDGTTPIAKPKIETFFKLSLVPAYHSTININPHK